MSYTLFKYTDGQTQFYDIVPSSYFRQQKDKNCKLVKTGEYKDLLHYCAENHIDF